MPHSSADGSRWSALRYRQAGVSLLELAVVLALVGTIYALSSRWFGSSTNVAREQLLAVQASAFKRNIDNIQTMAVVTQRVPVQFNEHTQVYVSSAGWPLATGSSAVTDVASLEGCRSLWRDLFKRFGADANSQQQAGAVTAVNDKTVTIDFLDNRRCRYRLWPADSSSHFFDYDLVNGQVMTSAPTKGLSSNQLASQL